MTQIMIYDSLLKLNEIEVFEGNDYKRIKIDHGRSQEVKGGVFD